MTTEARTPSTFHEQQREVAAAEVAMAYRSGASRSASLSPGGRYTIKGGEFVVEAADGTTSAYIGAVLPALPDGTYQPGFILYREDGTIAAALYDPTPDPSSPDGYKQFFAVYDRSGNITLSDDTSSGQGLARPYVPAAFQPTRYADMSVSTTSATFETLWDVWIPKQHPKLEVAYRATMDTTATTGEVQVLVDSLQLGLTTAESFAVSSRYIGPAAVAGTHMAWIHVEIQGRRTSASGALRVQPMYVYGKQS